MNVEKSVTVEVSTTGKVLATRTVENIVRLIIYIMRGVEVFFNHIMKMVKLSFTEE